MDLLDGSMAIVATLRGHALSLGHGDCHSTPPLVPHAPPAGPFESPNADGKSRLSAASADRRPNGSSGAPPACSKAEVGDNAAGESMRGDFLTGQTAASGMGNPVSASPEALANSPESADHAQGDSPDGQQPLPAVNSANARRAGSDAAAPVPTADGLAERHALDEQSGAAAAAGKGLSGAHPGHANPSTTQSGGCCIQALQQAGSKGGLEQQQHVSSLGRASLQDAGQPGKGCGEDSAGLASGCDQPQIADHESLQQHDLSVESACLDHQEAPCSPLEHLSLGDSQALDGSDGEFAGLGTGSTQGTPAAGDLAHHPSVSLSHENAAHVTAHGDGTKRLLDEAGEHSGHRDESNPQLAGSAQPASPSDTASADKSVRSSRGKTQEVPAQPGRLDSGPGTAKKTLARLQYGPEQSDKDTGKPPWVLDLWRSVYAHDARPLVPGCR